MFLKSVAHFYRKNKIHAITNQRYPGDIFLFVTERCNSKCPHCFYWQKDQGVELSEDQLLSLIDSLPATTESICLTGGEPTLRTDIVSIIEHALKKARSVTVCTNGIRINRIEEIAVAFKHQRSRLSFQLSVDGDEATHDSIRGKGAYRATMASINLLHKAKFSAVAVMTISKHNSTKMETVFQRLNGRVSEIRINIIRSATDSVWRLPADKLNISHNPRDSQIALPLMGLKEARIELMKINTKYPLWKLHNQLLLEKTINIISDEEKKRDYCFAGFKEAVIYQNGDVSFCEFYRPFANVADYGYNFMELWDSQIRRSNMRQIMNCCCLHSCNLSSSIELSEQHIIRSIKQRGFWRSVYRTARKTAMAAYRNMGKR